MPTYLSSVTLENISGGGTYLCNVTLDCIYVPGAEIETGSIIVTDASGVEIDGLVVGNFYSVEAYNGPWNYGAGNAYSFGVSNDGTTWGREMGWTDYFPTFRRVGPSWAQCVERIDAYYARMYWFATTTSIYIRVGDQPGDFGDNSGTLNYRLRSVDDYTLLNGVRLESG